MSDRGALERAGDVLAAGDRGGGGSADAGAGAGDHGGRAGAGGWGGVLRRRGAGTRAAGARGGRGVQRGGDAAAAAELDVGAVSERAGELERDGGAEPN